MVFLLNLKNDIFNLFLTNSQHFIQLFFISIQHNQIYNKKSIRIIIFKNQSPADLNFQLTEPITFTIIIDIENTLAD